MKKILFLIMIIILATGAASCKTAVCKTQVKVHEKEKSASLVVTDNIIIGAYEDGKWVDSKQAEKMVTGKEKFTFFSNHELLGYGLNAKIENFEDGNAVQISRDFNNTRSNDGFYKFFIGEIGISGGWNAMPRSPKSQNINSDIYKDIVKGILAKKGLTESKIDIKRVTGVDLDGDGTEEELITATDYNLEPKTIGTYSVIILRKSVNGSFQDIVIKEQYCKDKPEYEYVFDCPLIIDIDGDGVMELIIEGRFGAGSKIEFNKMVDSNINIIYATQFGA